MGEPLIERFLTKVEITDGCWLWLGPPNKGYGKLKVFGRGQLAHRIAYELFVGPIEENMVIHHICGNRLCVNPEHLKPMTRGAHNTHHILRPACKYGHLKVIRRNRQWCLVCERERSRRRYRHKKEAHVG